MTHPRIEREVWSQNVRDNQIGGATDGISQEVAEDLGFRPPDSITSVGSSAIIATESEPVRARRSRKTLSTTPAAIRARKRREKQARQIDERIASNRDPFGTDLGGR